MKKIYIAMMLIITLLLPACTSDEQNKEKEVIRIWIGDKPETAWTREYPVVNKLEEKLNINFEFITFPVSDLSQKYNLLMASGELPDLIVANMNDIKKYARQGAFEPLDEWLETAPNLERALKSDAVVKKTVTNDDGKIYAFPFITESSVSHVFMIREDWLKKLNLPVPVTLDDWYNTLKAFKENDPNENGLADEIPFSIRVPSKTDTTANLTPFMAAFGIDIQTFVEDGQVKFGAADPRMKDALTYINKLYSEKLLDNEYITTDVNMWNSKFERELSGASMDWITRMEQFENSIKPVNPDVKFIAVAPPIGPTGIQMQRKHQARVRGEAGAMSLKSKSKEAIIKLYDYIYSEEGSRLMNWGIEGVHYNVENGKMKFTDLIMKDKEGKSPQIAMFSYGIARDWPRYTDAESENAIATEAVLEGRKMYEEFIGPLYPVLTFTKEEGDVDTSKGIEIRIYTIDMINKFIMGVEPISNFDKFVAHLYEIGLSDYLKIQQSAYNRYIK